MQNNHELDAKAQELTNALAEEADARVAAADAEVAEGPSGNQAVCRKVLGIAAVAITGAGLPITAGVIAGEAGMAAADDVAYALDRYNIRLSREDAPLIMAGMSVIALIGVATATAKAEIAARDAGAAEVEAEHATG